MKVAPVELVEEKPPRFRAGCCDRKRRTPTRYRCHCEFSFFPSLRPPFIIMLGQSACPSWCSGLQLDPSSPRVASQPARLGAAARRFSLPSQLCMASQPARPGAAACSSILLAARGQSACPSWCSGPPAPPSHRGCAWPVSLPVLAQQPAARSPFAARGQSACPSWRSGPPVSPSHRG